jgi:bacillopeptidase F (M6 metalloprotease family)
MNYIVTHEMDGIAALDLGDGEKAFDLKGAIAFAGKLIEDGAEEVTIDDGNGNRVTGDDLALVIEGRKTLTDDLRVL